MADPLAPRIAEKLPYLPEDTASLVRINGAVQVGAGLMLALGRFPRLSSALLAGSLVPTTMAAHRFWEEEDDTKRAMQRIQFFENVCCSAAWSSPPSTPRAGPAGLARAARRTPRVDRHPTHRAGRPSGGPAGRPDSPGAPARLTVVRSATRSRALRSRS